RPGPGEDRASTEPERIVSIENLALINPEKKNRDIALTAKFIAVTFRQEDKPAPGQPAGGQPGGARPAAPPVPVISPPPLPRAPPRPRRSPRPRAPPAGTRPGAGSDRLKGGL